MEWYYWGTGHGKGPHDGAGACLKQMLRREQLKTDGWKLQNAADVVTFLNSTITLPLSEFVGPYKKNVNRIFWEIGRHEVDHNTTQFSCKTIPGSRSMHSVRSVSHEKPTLVEARDFSCFCASCVSRNPLEECTNLGHVQPWRLHTLEPCAVTEPSNEDDDEDLAWEGEEGDNFEAASLSVGDNFAIIAEPGNLEGADFYILQCTKGMHVVQEEKRTDSWGGEYDRGDEVVEGLYFKCQGKNEKSFILMRNAGTACIYSHLIFKSKFAMLQAKHKQKGQLSVYKLSPSKLAAIKDRVRAIRQLEQLENLEDQGPDCLSSDEESSDEESSSKGSSDSSSSSDFDLAN
jgi:hypothetical protein